MTRRLLRTFRDSPGRSPVGCIRRRAHVLSPHGCAVQAALQYPGQIATLILPADTAWLEADRPAPALPKPTPAIASAEAIDQAVAALGSGGKTMILIRGAALKQRGLAAAGRIAAASG